MEVKRRIIFIYCFLLLFSLLFITSFVVQADFGTEAGFGSDSFNGEFELDGGFADFPESQTPYFIHDTLIKLAFLAGFAIISILLVFKNKNLRKPLLFLSLLILGFYLGGFLCPFTAVQNVLVNFRTAYLLLFLIPTILALIFGRLFCGYICIFGGVQELINIPKLNLKIPDKVLKILHKLKYIILFYLVFRVIITNSVVLAGYTPFNALFSFGGNRLSIIITIITGIIALFIYRPFCQFLCPLGAWLGLCSTFTKYNILPEHCISCKACSNKCDLNSIYKGEINKQECILCGKCAASCQIPVNNDPNLSL